METSNTSTAKLFFFFIGHKNLSYRPNLHVYDLERPMMCYSKAWSSWTYKIGTLIAAQRWPVQRVVRHGRTDVCRHCPHGCCPVRKTKADCSFNSGIAFFCFFFFSSAELLPNLALKPLLASHISSNRNVLLLSIITQQVIEKTHSLRRSSDAPIFNRRK